MIFRRTPHSAPLAARVGSLALLCLLPLAGCTLPTSAPKPSRASLPTLRPTQRADAAIPASPVTLPVLQALVMRFADEYTLLAVQGLDDVEQRVATSQARLAAARLKVLSAAAPASIAAGPHPTVNLLDMLVLVTLSRMTFEDYWAPKVFGEDSTRELRHTLARLESEIWETSNRILSSDQQNELREMIQEWRTQNPEAHYVSGVRMRDFAHLFDDDPRRQRRGSSALFGLLTLDPLASLDPATRELEQTRFLGERLIHQVQRIPGLARWQTQWLLTELALMPEVQQGLTQITNFNTNLAAFRETLEHWPSLWAQSQKSVLQEVATQQPQLRALIADLRQTVEAANTLSASFHNSLRELDAFIGQFRAPARSPDTQTPPPTPDTQSQRRPFDVRDYGESALQIAQAAQELQRLTASLETSQPRWKELASDATNRGRDLVDYAFQKLLWILGLLLAGVPLSFVACGLVSRAFGRRPTERDCG